MIPCIIYFMMKYLKLNNRKDQIVSIVLLIIFLVYLFLVFYITGIDSIYYWDSPSLDTINIIPFDSLGEISYFLNIILFIPFGFLIPLIWDNYKVLNKTIFLGFSCSLIIEFLQLFCGRATDIDDLMMNTLGSILGYFIWKIFNCKEKDDKEENSIVGNKPIIWIFLLLFGYLTLYL